jgi:hypothetical protein
MKFVTLITIAATALSLGATPTFAKDKGHCPPGLAKKSPACVPPGQAKKGARADDRYERDRYQRDRTHRDADRYDRDDRDDDDYVYDRYRRGDRIPRDRYVRLEEGDRVIFEGREYLVVDTDNGTVLKRDNDWYRLPRYDDSDYVRVDDQVLRINRETQQVIDLIRLADLILG